MRRWIRQVALTAMLTFVLAGIASAQGTGSQGGGDQGGGGQGSGNQYCPYAYLFSTDTIHYYRLRKCAQNAYTYEGFGEEVSPLGCNANSTCKCGCMPNTHNPDLVDHTTSFTAQAGATTIQFGDAYEAEGDLDDQRALKVDFPGATASEWFRLVRVQVAATSSWTWIGVPTDAEELKGIAVDAMMASQSASGNPNAWAVGFNSSSGFATAWVMRNE